MGLVPEAESLVKPFRERYDPSAAVGVPAHISTGSPCRVRVGRDTARVRGRHPFRCSNVSSHPMRTSPTRTAAGREARTAATASRNHA
jgi:hypothetical protein